jgi:hypothetical protein
MDDRRLGPCLANAGPCSLSAGEASEHSTAEGVGVDEKSMLFHNSCLLTELVQLSSLWQHVYMLAKASRAAPTALPSKPADATQLRRRPLRLRRRGFPEACHVEARLLQSRDCQRAACPRDPVAQAAAELGPLPCRCLRMFTTPSSRHMS